MAAFGAQRNWTVAVLVISLFILFGMLINVFPSAKVGEPKVIFTAVSESQRVDVSLIIDVQSLTRSGAL